MGKKVHPYSLRIGVTVPWRSRWYAEGEKYVVNLHQDLKIKKMIHSTLNDAGIADIHIERYADQITITIFTSRPGIVIGRQGSTLDALKDKIRILLQIRGVDLKVEEIRKPEINAALIGNLVARQVKKRIPYRRCCKQAIEKAMESGVKGCKIRVSGRLNGAEIARSEIFIQGRIPLHTIRANIDYAKEACSTTYGKIGIKVWVYKGDVFADRKKLKNKKRENTLNIKEIKQEKKEGDQVKRNNVIDTAIEI